MASTRSADRADVPGSNERWLRAAPSHRQPTRCGSSSASRSISAASNSGVSAEILAGEAVTPPSSLAGLGDHLTFVDDQPVVNPERAVALGMSKWHLDEFVPPKSRFGPVENSTDPR